MNLRFADHESQNFGYKIFRAEKEEIEYAELISQVIQKKPDIVIFRTEVEHSFKLAPLLVDFDCIEADCLIEYRKRLTPGTFAVTTSSGIAVRFATYSDKPALETIIKESYADYLNHYHTNAFLQPGRILPGIVEYICSFLGESMRPSRVFIMQKGEEPVGFLVAEIHGDECTTTIGGVSSRVGALLRHKALADATAVADRYFYEQNCRHFFARTRVNKHYIQRLLTTSMRTVPVLTWKTFHLNLFLDKLTGSPVTKVTWESYKTVISFLPEDLQLQAIRQYKQYNAYSLEKSHSYNLQIYCLPSRFQHCTRVHFLITGSGIFSPGYIDFYENIEGKA